MWWLIEIGPAILKAFAYFKTVLKTLCSSALILLSAYYLNTEEKIDNFVNSSSSYKQSDIWANRHANISNREYSSSPARAQHIDCLECLWI